MRAKNATLEAKPHHVRVNTVSPAGVVTPMWKKIAKTIAFLASDDAANITAAGIVVDAGYTA
jgi:NAD(P)-dependent dehydrogenase (short-subunit alcohol dehydrogenase family)